MSATAQRPQLPLALIWNSIYDIRFFHIRLHGGNPLQSNSHALSLNERVGLGVATTQKVDG